MAYQQREGVNPLRPYYIPPTIGDEPLPAPGPHAFADGAATGKYTSKARDIFSDIDYKDYISEDSSSVVQTVKDLLDELLWKYTSVLMAQPFDVAKTILQVRSQEDIAPPSAPITPVDQLRRRGSDHRSSIYDDVCSPDSHSRVVEARAKMLRYSSQILIPTRMSRLTLPRTHLAHPLHPTPGRRGNDRPAPYDHPEYSHNQQRRRTSSSCEPQTRCSRSYHNYGRRREHGAFGKGQMRHSCILSSRHCSKTGLGAC